MKTISTIMQIKEAFLELYSAGEFAPNTRLPSETVMAKRFNVSRETWRATLDLLRKDGIIVTHHGSGSYTLDIRGKRIGNELSQLRSLSRMISDAGLEEDPSEYDCKVVIAPPEVQAFFRTDQANYFCIRRLRFAGGQVISGTINYMPLRLADRIDFHQLPPSLFKYLEEAKRIIIVRSHSEIVVPRPDDPLVLWMNVPPGTRILGFRQQHRDKRSTPVLYSIDYLCCEYFNFTIERNRK